MPFVLSGKFGFACLFGCEVFASQIVPLSIGEGSPIFWVDSQHVVSGNQILNHVLIIKVLVALRPLFPGPRGLRTRAPARPGTHALRWRPQAPEHVLTDESLG